MRQRFLARCCAGVPAACSLGAKQRNRRVPDEKPAGNRAGAARGERRDRGHLYLPPPQPQREKKKAGATASIAVQHLLRRQMAASRAINSHPHATKCTNIAPHPVNSRSRKRHHGKRQIGSAELADT